MQYTLTKNLLTKLIIAAVALVAASSLLVYFLTLHQVDQKYKALESSGGSVSVNTSDLSKDYVSLKGGNPQAGAIDVSGDIAGNNVQGSTITSTVQDGTSPLNVSSSTLVNNLNADMVDGKHASELNKTTNNITQQTVNNVTNTTTGETIQPGTTGDYYRGDKSWQTLNSSAVGLGNVENTALSTWKGSNQVAILGTVTSGTWNAGSINAAGSITGTTLQGSSLNLGSGAITSGAINGQTISSSANFTGTITVGGTINGATISGGTLSGGNVSGGTVQGGTLSSTAVNGVTTANILVNTGSYSDPSWLQGLAGSKITGDISGNASGLTGTPNITVGTINSGSITTGDAITQTITKNPTIVGTAALSGGADGLFVQGKYAYAVGGANFFVIDVSNPSAPTLVATLTDAARMTHVYGIYVAGSYAYVATGYGGSQGVGDDRLTVIDISNPKSPSIVGSLQDHTNLYYALHVYVSGNYAYVSAPYNNQLTIVDISNPADPLYAGSVQDNTTLYRADGTWVQGRYAYVISHNFNGPGVDYLNAIDVSNPKKPFIVSSLSSTNFRGGDQMYVSGKYAYVPGNANNEPTSGHTMSVVDISNPSSMSIVGSYTSSTYVGSSCYVFGAGKYVYLTSADNNRLTVVDVSNPTSPQMVGSVQDNSYLAGAVFVQVAGKYAYVTTNGYLDIIDITGMDAPSANIGALSVGYARVTENIEIANDAYVRSGLSVGDGGISSNGKVSTPSITVAANTPILAGSTSGASALSPKAIFVRDRYAYVVNSAYNYFLVYDVSNPESTSFPDAGGSGALQIGSGLQSVYVQGRYAYVIDKTGSKLYVVDVSNPASPTLVNGSGNSTGGSPMSVYVQGRYAFVTNSAGAMQAFDISNPASPSLSGFVYTGGGTDVVSSIYVQGRYAYVTDQTGSKLYVVDVSNPASMTVVNGTGTATGGGPDAVYVQSKYVFVTNGYGAMQAFDISNPASPSLSGFVYTGGGTDVVSSIYVQGRYAYVTDQTGSKLYVVDVSNPASMTVVNGTGTATGTSPTAIFVQGQYAYITDNTEILQSFNLGGGYIQQVEIGGIQVGTADIRNNIIVNNDASIAGGLSVTRGEKISGSSSITNTDGDAGLRIIQGGANYAADLLENKTAQTVSNGVINVSNTGATFNTTSGALSSYGGYFSSVSTRSAGTNNLTNVGIYATASGAQVNHAAEFNTPVTDDSTASVIITPTAAGNKGLVVQGYTSQTADLLQGQDSLGNVLFSVDSSGNLTAKSATFTGTLTMNGHIITGNSSGSTTIVAGANAGTGATASISGNDTSGTITVNTGTSPSAGTLATITFISAYGAAPNVVLTPKGNAAATLQYNYGSSTTSFTLNSGTAPAASTTYTYSYMVMQ